jgi:hypothetical protein
MGLRAQLDFIAQLNDRNASRTEVQWVRSLPTETPHGFTS